MFVIDQTRGLARSENGVHGAGTAASSRSSGAGDVDVGADEADVQDDGDERSERVSGKAAQEH